MPSARAVFLFPSSGHNAHTSISPAQRRYTLFEGSNVKLYYRQEKARRAHLRAFIVYTAICGYSIRPRKRYRRAPAAFRRLFIRPSGRGCFRLFLRLLRSFRPSVRSIYPARSAASGQRVRRSGGGAPSQGGFVSVPSVIIPLSMPFFLLLSACSRVVRVKVVSQSRQSRESRQVKSRKSRKGRDIRVPTCAKVVKL